MWLMYGLTELDDEILRDLESGIINLMGCTLLDEDPEWLCRKCGHTWGNAAASFD